MSSPDTVSRRQLLIGAACAATATGAFALAPRREEHRLLRRKLGDLVPVDIGPWHYESGNGVIVARAEEALRADTYDQVIGRVYEAPDNPSIMLLVAYGSTQGSTLQLHRPETCYPGQGFILSDFSDRELPVSGTESLPSRWFTATRDSRVERLLYWTRIGNSFPLNTVGEYRAILGSVLRGTIPDGILVRVSTLEPDIVLANQALQRFATMLVMQAPTAGQQILVGTAIASGSRGAAGVPRR